MLELDLLYSTLNVQLIAIQLTELVLFTNLLEIYFRAQKISEDTVVDILYRRDVFSEQVRLSSWWLWYISLQ